MAGDAAASSGMSFDRWEDLELAVDELASLLLQAAPEALQCVLRPTAEGVAVEMSAIGPDHAPVRDELAELVLAGVTAELTLSLEADPPQGAFLVTVG